MRELNKYLRNIFLVYNCYRLQNLNFNAYKFTHNNGKLKKKTWLSVSLLRVNSVKHLFFKRLKFLRMYFMSLA
ncbi:MAG: hypothetical protein A3K50_07150 [Planctomycetes bacterium RIFOXYD12_FULL_42_12]|nr:MAG: hypothetical protein A3K50_07150 [Planctomycetes bacterium RIFOXYD12_FULL_42_12]